MKTAEGTVLPLQDLRLEELQSGYLHRLWLELPLGLLSGLCLPCLVIKGATSGPILLVTAGVHGDEFEGMVAIPRFVRSLDPGTLAGTIIGLPICNPFAFAAQSRESPASVDGRNLAREFPGHSDGSVTQRLAVELFSLVRRLLGPEDLFVDLHSGGTRYRYLPMVGYRDIDGPSRRASEEAARHFGSGRLWLIDDTPGTLNSETSRIGIPTIGTEATGQGECRPEDVAAYVKGLRNLLRYQNMVQDGRPPVRDDGSAWRPTQINASSSGLFLSHVNLGQRVSTGEPLGEILSPFGKTLERLGAPHAGEVWVLRVFGTMHAGDLAAWVARPYP
jgi:predicted deacylase